MEECVCVRVCVCVCVCARVCVYSSEGMSFAGGMVGQRERYPRVRTEEPA